MTYQEALRIVLKASGEYVSLIETWDTRDSERNRCFTLAELLQAQDVVWAVCLSLPVDRVKAPKSTRMPAGKVT